MNTAFYERIKNSTAHRPIRDLLSGEVLNDISLLPDLLAIAFDVNDKNHHKACWISELVFEAKIEWLSPYLNIFCETLSLYKNESALRPIAKICLFATEHNDYNPGFLSPNHKELITEASFD